MADCKLASSENLTHIARRGGRFVTVLPRTYKEDGVFRARLRESPSSVTWRQLYDVTNERGRTARSLLDLRRRDDQRRRLSTALVSQHAQGGVGRRDAEPPAAAGLGRTGRFARATHRTADAVSPTRASGTGRGADSGGA